MSTKVKLNRISLSEKTIIKMFLGNCLGVYLIILKWIEGNAVFNVYSNFSQWESVSDNNRK